MSRSTFIATIAAAAALALGFSGVVAAEPAPDVESRTTLTAAPDIKLANIKSHLSELSTIAKNNNGNRAAGTSGYAESADFIAQELSAAGFSVTRQECTSCRHSDDNIIADWPGGLTTETVMIGAHLDSVAAGPGINDNGSGSAALLEVALELSRSKPSLTKHVRFAWWAEEELGMHGSAHYVNTVGVNNIDVYLNLDMVGSTNAGYFVDNINDQQSAPFANYLSSVGFAPEEMTDCCSDNVPFENAGVPTTLITTGYGELKTPAQANKWGGEAGKPYDPCYHTACDSYPDNINMTALNHMADATAVGLWTAAQRPSGVYNPRDVCGAGFKVQERETLKAQNGAVVAETYLLWNGTTKENCATTIKLANLGTASNVGVTLLTDNGKSVDDIGAFKYYAGPVKLAAAGQCVSVEATMTHNGTTLNATIPMGHCG